MRLIFMLTAMGMVLASTVKAQAEIVQLQALMNGAQAVPQTPSPGSGVALFDLDTESGILTMLGGSYQDLIGEVHMAHVHGFAPPGSEGGMLFMLDHTGGTSGTLSVMNNQVQLKEADIQGMLAGLTYIVVHTHTFMAGEIRGQIYQIPSPGALAMFGLVGLTSKRRRR